jgi:hypothetical protein
VLKLLQLIDGRKRSASGWHDTLSHLLDAGFMVSSVETAMFTVREAGSNASLIHDGVMVRSLEDLQRAIFVLGHLNIRRLGSITFLARGFTGLG